jgi:hypothetical protein
MVNCINIAVQCSQTAPLKLKEAYQSFGGDQPQEIPWMVRLFENSASFIALPGKINLHNHDCLHILLDRGFDNRDEAFVVGFTMGNDSQTNGLHVQLYKFVSRFLYPPIYRFDEEYLRIFDLGFLYGKRLKVKNLNQLDFSSYYATTVHDLRQLLGIEVDELKLLKQFEQWLLPA